MQHPPTRINILEKTQFGIPVRALSILAVAAIAAGGVFFGLLRLGLIWSGTLAVLLAGLGVALAFGEIDGQKPETWLLNWVAFRRRARYMVKGARLDPGEVHVTIAPATPQSAPAPGPEPESAPTPLPPETRRAPGFFALSGSAVCVAALTGLTLYLAGGGAERLLSLLRRL
jgi:hypothetical protein